MDAKEIAETMIEYGYHLGTREQLNDLARAYLDQETRIQGLVETLEKLRDEGNEQAGLRSEFQEWDLFNEIAEQAITAYKEGK